MIDAACQASRTSPLPTIGRDRLLADFVAADPRLVKIVAPAGYGKTTFALSLAEMTDFSAYCDCLHVAKPIDLIRGVLDALSITRENRADLLEASLALGGDEAEWLIYAGRALRDIDKTGTLIFDNCEALLSKNDVCRIVEKLLAAASPRLRLVVCSRVEIPISFGRFAAPHRTMRVGAEDLRFSDADMQLLFSGLGSGAATIRRVIEFSQGWPMLTIMFFVLAKRGRLDAYLYGSESDATDLYAYLASEVFETLEPACRDTLYAVVALPDARSSDLEALFGDLTNSIISSVGLTTPFLSSGPNGTLVVHPAVAEMLRRSRDRGESLARSIADALAASNPGRAARIFAHLNDYDRAASLLEASRYWLTAPSPDLIDVLYAIPSEAIIRYPAVWNVASYARALSRDAVEWLNEAHLVRAAMPEGTPIDVRVELFSNFMNIYTQRGEFAKARRHSAEFATTPAGRDPMGAITIRFWELVEQGFRGGVIDRRQCEEEIGPLLRLKVIEILWDFDLYARHERLGGNAAAERAILERVIDNASATGDLVLRYITLCEGIFGAWFWGDDERLERYVVQLKAAAHPSIDRAMTLLISSLEGRIAEAHHGTEQLKVRAYAYLIAAGRERVASVRRALLHQAIIAGDASGQPFTASIARVALGLSESAESSRAAFVEALALARQTWSERFQDAVTATAQGILTGHMLESFVARFLEPDIVSVSERTIVEIGIVDGTVRIDGRPIALSGREYELLVFLSLRDSPVSADLLSESLWPESDADRARRTFKVTLSRLRARLGEPSLIICDSSGYWLQAKRRIDVGEFLLRSRPNSNRNLSRMRLESARFRLSAWPWARDFESRLWESEIRSY